MKELSILFGVDLTECADAGSEEKRRHLRITFRFLAYYVFK